MGAPLSSHEPAFARLTERYPADTALRIPPPSRWPEGAGPVASIERRSFGDLTVALATLPAGRLIFEPDTAVTRDKIDCRLAISLNTLVFDIGGRTTLLRRGDMLFGDLSQPRMTIADHPTRYLSLALPRDVITRRFAGSQDVPVVILRGTGAMASLFRACMFKVWRADTHLPPSIAAELAETKIDILVEAICEALHEPQNAGLEQLATRMQISSAIVANLSDPKFDAATLAARMDLSPKGLARVLGDVTPTDLIRQLRLAQARRLLRTGALAGLTVTEIAHRVGFANLAHFSTLYAHTFGNSPAFERNS